MELDSPSDYDSELMRVVAEYLTEQPDAMDNVEGIAEWWIARNQIRVDVDILSRVLSRMTEGGVLTEVWVAGQAYYRLNRNSVN